MIYVENLNIPQMKEEIEISSGQLDTLVKEGLRCYEMYSRTNNKVKFQRLFPHLFVLGDYYAFHTFEFSFSLSTTHKSPSSFITLKPPNSTNIKDEKIMLLDHLSFPCNKQKYSSFQNRESKPKCQSNSITTTQWKENVKTVNRPYGQ